MPSTENIRGDRGHALFSMLVLLPLLFALGTFSVSLSEYHSEGEALQREADRIAFTGASLLPATDQLKDFLDVSRSELSGRAIELRTAELDTATGNLTVELERRLGSMFTDFASRVTAKDIRLTAVKRSVASIVPGDFALVVSLRGSLRPQFSTLPSGALVLRDRPWGSALEWPESPYFDRCGGGPLPVSALHGVEAERVATQSCFNPVFSALKLGAITLVDTLGAQPANRVALVFTPGEGDTVSVARPLNDARGGFLADDVNAELDWKPYDESASGLGDLWCALFSHPSVAGERYKLFSPPEHLRRTKGASACNSPLELSPCALSPARAVSAFRSCYFTRALSLREGIYWKAAKDSSARASVSDAVAEALKQFEQAHPTALRETEEERRGRFRLASQRRLIVFTDSLDVARPKSPQTLLTHAQALDVRIAIALLLHPHLDGDDRRRTVAARAEWQEAALALAAEGDTPRLEVFTASDPEDLVSEIVPSIVATTKKIALRR